MAHHARVIELAIAHDRQRHLTRVALDRQVAGHRVVVGARRLDPGALEGDPRVLLELQEVGRLQVVVALGVVGLDARDVDGHLERRVGGIFGIDRAAAGDVTEMAAHGHHAQVLDRELDLRVIRVQSPGHRYFHS